MDVSVQSPEVRVESVPLVVDLDGTLIKTDLLVESAVRLLRRNPFYLFAFAWWLLAGKHVLKREVARRVRIDPALLPYNQEFLRYLEGQQAAGRKLVLATASPALLAGGVFRLHGLFDELFSSDDSTNLAGHHKRDALVARFGYRGFDYAGNARPDLLVWRSARKSILVNPSPGLEARARAIGNFDQVFSSAVPALRAWARSLRLHQWLKNLLVLAPLVAAHAWTDPLALIAASTLFVAFCLTASAVYQINDVVDLDADRSHRRKRGRPIAAGDLSILAALGTAVLLLAAGLAIAWQVSLVAFWLLALYLGLTFAYSFVLKSHALIDLVALASLYTLRIIAGAAAIMVVPSYWLLAFSMFIFLSLAALKRCSELQRQGALAEGGRTGRGYRSEDLPYLTSFGTSAGSAAVVILALYINSGETAGRYGTPEFLWLLCPLLVYWIGRMWIKTGRGEMHDDPIVFAAIDRGSQATAVLGMMLLVAAI